MKIIDYIDDMGRPKRELTDAEKLVVDEAIAKLRELCKRMPPIEFVKPTIRAYKTCPFDEICYSPRPSAGELKFTILKERK